jgi:diaminopimelate decarboxylase
MACKIKEAFGLELDYVDIGGGFYGGMKDKPQFCEYLEVISEELGKAFDRESTTLILEPGTSLVSSPFSYVTRVTDVKDTTVSRFAVTDGSRIHIDPLMKKNKYSCRIEYGSKAERLIMEKQVISGFTCIEDDRLFVLENHPELAQGDYVIYEKVGAYTICLAPLFIRYYPAVYVKDGDLFYTVREKWTAEEYVAKSKLYISNVFSEEGLV